mgnify:CR=1 FL=1
MKKRFPAAVLAGILVFGAVGCGREVEKSGQEEVELTVFAAASLTETLNEIGEIYMEENPHIRLQFNFDSSGTLKTQIQEGADCDLFLSAAQKQMDQLDARSGKEKNPEGLDFVLEDTRIDLLENQVVLCTDPADEGAVESFEEMAKALREGRILLGMGNADVPVGQYTGEILKFYGLSEEALAAEGLISYGTNVKEVTAQIAEGSVDCGVIYSTDASAAGLSITERASGEMCSQALYPAAVMKNSGQIEEAREFLAWLQGEEAMEVFQSAGFKKAACK